MKKLQEKKVSLWAVDIASNFSFASNIAIVDAIAIAFRIVVQDPLSLVRTDHHRSLQA